MRSKELKRKLTEKNTRAKATGVAMEEARAAGTTSLSSRMSRRRHLADVAMAAEAAERTTIIRMTVNKAAEIDKELRWANKTLKVPHSTLRRTILAILGRAMWLRLRLQLKKWKRRSLRTSQSTPLNCKRILILRISQFSQISSKSMMNCRKSMDKLDQ